MARLRPSALLWAILCAAVLQGRSAAGETRWPDLSHPETVNGAGAGDAAIVVGVEHYLTVPGVPGAVQNAGDWYTYFTKGLRIPPANVVLLRNNEATLEKMRKHIARATEAAKPGGTLWFVFIGHGAPAQDGRDGVLVGVDAQQDADSLFARSLPKKELLAILGRGAQKRTMVVIDACFSGRTGTGAAIVEGLQPLIAVRETAGTEKALIFSAGRADEFAGALPGLSRPAFSYLLLGALRGWGDADANGRVTAHEAVDYTRGALRALVKDRNQTPELSGGSPSDVVGMGKEAGPDISAMVLASMPVRRPASNDVTSTPLGKPGSAQPGAAPVRRTPSIDLSRYSSRPTLGAADMAAVDSRIGKISRLLAVTQEDDPQKPDFHFRLGEQYDAKCRYEFQQKDYEKGQRWLVDAVKSYVAATKFPRYERKDEVLFKLADLLTWARKEDQAREFFLRLVKDHPSSKFIPDAYLAFGEYYFGKGDMDAALKFYQKVEQFPKAAVYPYAVYKKGWCHANLRDPKAALETFVAVIRGTQEARANVTSEQRLALQDEAKKDAARVYADIGGPAKAAGFFKQVGGESWRMMLDVLAAEYTDRGRVQDAALVRKGAP